MPDTQHLQETKWEFKTIVENAPLGGGGYWRSSNTGMTQAQMDTLYKGTSLEGKVTRTPTTGYQQFTVPYTGLFIFEVQGSQGGHHGSTNANIGANYGGRGAKLTGTFLLHKDDIIYILVGEPGRCQGAGLDGGGGGGGASAVFLVDTSEASQYTFSQTGKKVIPLIVAGGGAGQSDYTTGSEVASANVFNDNCTLNAKIENGTNTQGGSGSYRGGAGLVGGYGTNPLLLGATTSHAGSATVGYGGFGGGGDPYNGGGGGAGWSGGNFSDGYNSYGGTSWIDDSAMRVTRELAPVVRGFTVPGHVTMTNLISDSKKILAKDSDGIKSYSVDNDLWSLIADQTVPPVSATFDTYGVVSAQSINGLKTDTEIEWYIKSNSPTEIIYLESLLNNAKVLSTYDMDLSVFTKIDSIRVNTHTLNVIISCLFSTDFGNTWYTYNNGEWLTVDINNKADFSSKGVLFDNVATLPLLELTEKTGSSMMQVCFLVTENALTNASIIESISISGSALSGWESAIKGTDYTYKHNTPSNIEITFKVAGTYKVNYPYSS